MPYLNDVYNGCEYDANPSWSLGWDLMFVHWRNKTHLHRFSVHWRKKTHLSRFSTGVYKEGSFNSWRGGIFHLAQLYFSYQVFSLKTLVPRTIDAEVVYLRNAKSKYLKFS